MDSNSVVAIARTLAIKPHLLLYDDPTSELEPEMIKEVLDVMTDLSESWMTSVVVTHEMRFSKRVADQIIFMESSDIVETTTVYRFFSDEITATLPATDPPQRSAARRPKAFTHRPFAEARLRRTRRAGSCRSGT